MKDNHKADVSHTDEFDRMYQEMVKQAEDKHKVKSEHPKTEEEIGLVDIFSSRWVNEFELPEGYIFKDENGNEILTSKIILEKKKKEYPKTYEKCCKVLGYDDIEAYCIFHTGADERLFEALYRLKVCRDAYWKIYGEEKGLGKPWEPDWNDEKQDTYGLYNEVKYTIINPAIFLFPTEEMRDAFKENFDPDIDTCKELL